jgi:trimeric autotransporter adhesin
MALTKEQLEALNQSSFPNNNSGEITATDLRTFNQELIDNTVNQTVYTADSASFDARIDAGGGGGVPAGTISGSSQVDYPLISNIPSGIVSSSAQISDITGSSLVTASFATQTLTFTKGDGTTFGVNIPDVSGSDITALNAFTASQEELNTTFATTGSNTFTGDQNVNGKLAITQSTATKFDGITEVSYPFTSSLGATGYVRQQFSNLGGAGTTFAQLVGGVDFAEFKTAAETNLIFVSQGKGINFTAIQSMNFETSGSVNVNADSGINLNNNTTIDANGVVNGTNLAPGSTFIVKDGNSTPRLQVQNATLAGLTGADIVLNGDVLLDGTFTNDGDTIINGTNAAPGNTFIAKDGNGASRLQVNNATLKGLTGVDVVINGNTTLDGIVVIDDATTINGNLENTGSFANNGDTTIVGTNLAPGNTFTAKDGNGTPRLSVQNATLKGLTGADVLVNGNTILDGTVTIDDNTTINGNLENTGSFTNGGDTTVVGTNLAPGNTFIVKDGNNTARIQVTNAALRGITGTDVILNGTVLNDGNATITGTNAAPAQTFIVKDGNSVARLEVNNATLSGLVGLDVNLNGTVQITETLKMLAQNPLPSGVVGELAVSGSALYFYDGAWKTVSLV